MSHHNVNYNQIDLGTHAFEYPVAPETEPRDAQVQGRYPYLGVQEVALEQIAGNVNDPGHTPLLQILFRRMTQETTSRFDRTENAPVRLYQVGARYFVAGDGRLVAEARSLGCDWLHAEVWAAR